MNEVLALLTGPAGIVAGIVAAVVAVLGLLGAARHSGGQSQRLQDAEDKEQARVDADAAEAKVDRLSDVSAVAELRRDFTRKR